MDAFNSTCITGVATTVTELLGAAPPKYADACIAPVTSRAREKFKGPADRVLLYNPDAVAQWLSEKYKETFAPLLALADITLPMLSVMPCVTPVCFASMYSGALPEVHGITTYEKPVLKIDTLFDALLRSGKKVAIVSTAGDSISVIFLERDMPYFIFDTVEECTKKAMELIDEDEYDCIVLYHPDYDNAMHRYGPESPEALGALSQDISTFISLAERTERKWAAHNTVLAFAPDHGCHQIDGGCGSHGLNMTEDMNILHFYCLQERRESEC